MNKLKFVALLGVGVLLGWFIFFRGATPPAGPSNEPISERTLAIAPGLAVERDRFGNISSVNVISTSANLTLDDFNKSLESKYIDKGVALALNRGSVTHDGEDVIENLISITNQNFLDLFGFSVKEGRFFSDNDSEQVAVVGKNLADELREKGVENVIGETLVIRGNNFNIIGELNPIESGDLTADADWNKMLLVPFHQSDNIIDSGIHLIEEVRLAANSTKVLVDARNDVTRLLEEQRGELDFSVLTPADLDALGL